MWKKLPLHLKVDENRYLISKSRLIASHRLCQEIGVDSNLDRIRDILKDKVLSNITLPYTDLISTARESSQNPTR
ncbi:MAG: hypothetical protein HY279_08600 [Nitrospinae bacterium]|nr:hypothetical protein [Nitrospinota bacterium]